MSTFFFVNTSLKRLHSGFADWVIKIAPNMLGRLLIHYSYKIYLYLKMLYFF